MMKSVCIATPVYQKGTPDYRKSIKAAEKALNADGWGVRHCLLGGCCYVHTARNKLVRSFLESGEGWLLFWDADIGCDPDDIMRLMKHDVPIVGGAAPFREGPYRGFPVEWKQEDGVPLGIEIDSGRLIEAEMIATAMLKIQRDVFLNDKIVKQSPLRIEWDRQTLDEFMRWRSYFDFEADEERHLEFGEDVTFCRKCQRAGYQIWIEPNMTIRHGSRSGNLDIYLRVPGDAWEN